LYQPNIALISGIAWDHINVFPTYQNYVEQFEIFVDQISRGGILVYNEEDLEVKRVEAATKPTRKLAYTTQIIKWKTEQRY
jgi:UDP-N-acetylmuramate: L-alanyl-gamma-D-glutamyl-meso-diaminopimelate ligase